ncbi:MAG: FAD-binding oxidoreductase, partial [Actinomycetota bacterium]
MTSIHGATRRLFERLRDETVDIDAEFVVAPTSTEEAAEVLSAAAEARVPVSFHGGGTHLGYGNRPDTAVVMTTSRMNRIVEWQPEDLTVVVEAGVRVDDLEAELVTRNQSAVLPEVAPGATVGGVIAAGLSGYRRLRYGPTRDRVLLVNVATGYGAAVKGGSPVVKASTGYGVPRIVTGSFGSLGLIGSAMLKLWSQPQATATVKVTDAVSVLQETYRPLAVLETSEGSFLYLAGAQEQIDAQASQVGGVAVAGLAWPERIGGELRAEFRVPARHVAEAIRWTERLETDRWIAEHGVGRVVGNLNTLDPDVFISARAWAESIGGALLLVSQTDTGVDPWGSPPASIE